MIVTDEKKTLRKELIQRRRSMSDDVKALADRRVFERLIPLLDTKELLKWCFEHGKTSAVPVSGDSELTFYPIRSFDELSVGRFNIMEPVDRSSPAVPDKDSLCIVPALCCDRIGHRLGYGRGYYDRFLESFPGRSVIVCYSDFVMNVPTEPHDRKADEVITD